MIKKLPSGKYKLYSRSKDTSGKRKNLGIFTSLEQAKKREQQINFFKHQNSDDAATMDDKDKLLNKVSNIAQYLEEAGYVEKANNIYNLMAALDGSLAEDYAQDLIPDAQYNPNNQGYIGGEGPGGGYSALSVPSTVVAKLISIANELDRQQHHSLADELDGIINGLNISRPKIKKRRKKKKIQKPADIIAPNTGLMENTVVEMGAGFNGFSDQNFYTNIT